MVGKWMERREDGGMDKGEVQAIMDTAET